MSKVNQTTWVVALSTTNSGKELRLAEQEKTVETDGGEQ